MGAKLRGLYQRGKTFWLRWTVAGVQHRVSLQTDDLNVALIRARDYRSRPALAGVDEWAVEVDRYLSDQVGLGRLRPDTASVRRYQLAAFARQMAVARPNQVGLEMVRRYYAARQKAVSESAAQSSVVAVRAFYNWLVRAGRVRENPASGLQVRSLPAPARRWFASHAEVRRLIEGCEREDLRFVLLCGFRAGLRIREIIEARRCWFSPESVHVQDNPMTGWRPKDRDNRSIPLSRDFREFLAGWAAFNSMSPDAYVLHPEVERGRARLRWDPRRPFADYVRACGLSALTPHGMRTTFASLHVQAGTSVYKVAVWLGDRVDVVQKHYAHLLPSHDPEIDRVL